jgi:choline dehydrogenase-like flavoprotein
MVMLATSALAQYTPDICIVGMGPAGLTLALEAEKRGLLVLLVETGSIDGTPVPTDTATITDPKRHAPLPLASFQGLGGTSWLWGGRCVPFEAIDFKERSYVPNSGWPCTYEALAPWYNTAAQYLDCGNARFRSDADGWDTLPDVDLSQHERWARQPQLAHRLRERVVASERILLLCDTTVTGITFDNTHQSVQSLLAQHQSQTLTLTAKQYVLACGGVETTRLLLAMQQTTPHLFAGRGGPLGRYYMGHIFGSIASIVLNNPDDARMLDFHQDATGTYVRRRFTIKAEAQEEHRLLNTSFYIDNPPFYDATHGNATLSTIFLALRIPAIGRRLITEAIRLRHIGPPPYHIGKHLINIARNPFRVAADVVAILRDRYMSRVRKPGFILRNQGGTYALNYHAEQVPNPESRITLGERKTGQHLPDVDIDFRYLEQDAASVLRAHALLDNALRSSGKGYIRYHREETQRMAHIMDEATDGFHQVGTTRMGNDPATSIVDSQGQVHQISNLFIASSSIFPTTGEANPTLLLAAFAARMAAFIASKNTVSTPQTATTE